MAAVYEIQNIRNGKVYIGSTTQLWRNRKNKHWSELRAGIHHNAHLQAAWNKYGEDAFKFVVVLELDCSEAEIRDIETQLIRKSRLELGFENVYTYLEGAENPMTNADDEVRERHRASTTDANRRKWEDPTFRSVRLASLRSAEARERVSAGMQNRWDDDYYAERQRRTLADANSREYPGLVSPAGEVFAPIRNLNAFCRERGLDVANMQKVATGKGRLKSYKGWTRYDPDAGP